MKKTRTGVSQDLCVHLWQQDCPTGIEDHAKNSISMEAVEVLLFCSEEDRMPLHIQDDHALADSIKVICELPKTSVPCWKIFPSQFILYP